MTTKEADHPKSPWNSLSSSQQKIVEPQEQARPPAFDDSVWDEDSINLNDSSTQFETSKTAVSSADEDRDEVKEIQQFSAKETAWIRRWRLLTTLVLLGTACAVTITTYRFLKEEQSKNFEQAVCIDTCHYKWC